MASIEKQNCYGLKEYKSATSMARKLFIACGNVAGASGC
jgi:hypothetical protein